MNYLLTAFFAYLVNIPCGYIRERFPKFSFAWFFWIHASIPVLIFIRISLKVSPWFIPAVITAAVYGQIAGSRWKNKKITRAEIEHKEQIPARLLLTVPQGTIHDRDVEVVLMNMGGPKTNADVPDFQRRLFNDSLLIRFPLSGILQPFFSWLLVTLRGKEAQKRYRLIGGGSPIYPSTEAQVAALGKEFQGRGRGWGVSYSFNYSPPLPEDTIKDLKSRGKKCIVPLSLYPHYSAATTGSNVFYLKEAAKKIYPDLKFIESPQYHLHEGYIQGFIDRIYESLKPNESLSDFYLIFSTHGLPKYFLAEGDPYPFQISQTVGSIVTRLNRDHSWIIAYQSAVGPLQWLQPSTESVLTAVAKRGIKKVLIIPISFVSDHIETTCEIDMEYRKVAEDLGIKDFRMTKALEAHPGFIRALADTVETVLPQYNQKENQEGLAHVG